MLGATANGGVICRLDQVWPYVSTLTGGSINSPPSYGGCHDSSGLNGGNGYSWAWTGEIALISANSPNARTSSAIKIFFMVTVKLPNNIFPTRVNYTYTGSRLLDYRLTGN
jgi:hypothetical protein